MIERARGPGRLAAAWDMLALVGRGGPAVCNIAVTTACNAACGFCGYARDREVAGGRIRADAGRVCRGLETLWRRGVRYVTFTGGEPTLHPDLPAMIARARGLGMRASVVSNGATLRPEMVARLADAGLGTMFLSIDAPDAAAHEAHRGLPGVAARIRAACGLLKARGVKTVASVTLSRLVADDLGRLAGFLAGLGFATVTFSYPKTVQGSSSLVFSGESPQIDFSPDELAAAFERVRDFKRRFPVLNPDAALAEMIRHLGGQPERFPCLGGGKYFYVDADLMVWRCDAWPTPIAPLEAFGEAPEIRDGCTRCMSDCYRDASVFLHFPMALGDAVAALRRGRPLGALGALATRSCRESVAALLVEWRTLRALAGRKFE